MQIMDLSFVAIFLGSSNEFFAADGTKRAFALVDAFDVDEQVRALAVRAFTKRTLMPHLLVDALDVCRQYFARIIHLLTINAFQFSLNVFDEAMVPEPVFAVEEATAVVALVLLLEFVTVSDVFLHLGDAHQFPAYFARRPFYFGQRNFRVRRRFITGIATAAAALTAIDNSLSLRRRFRDDPHAAILLSGHPRLVHVTVGVDVCLRHESEESECGGSVGGAG